MLEMRPSCENCDIDLPNDSDLAMICTFECTFCRDCVNDILKNVCPNCGGGFEKRPSRPTSCLTENCIENYPISTIRKYKPIKSEKFKVIQDAFVNIDPRKR